MWDDTHAWPSRYGIVSVCCSRSPQRCCCRRCRRRVRLGTFASHKKRYNFESSKNSFILSAALYCAPSAIFGEPKEHSLSAATLTHTQQAYIRIRIFIYAVLFRASDALWRNFCLGLIFFFLRLSFLYYYRPSGVSVCCACCGWFFFFFCFVIYIYSANFSGRPFLLCESILGVKSKCEWFRDITIPA